MGGKKQAGRRKAGGRSLSAMQWKAPLKERFPLISKVSIICDSIGCLAVDHPNWL